MSLGVIFLPLFCCLLLKNSSVWFYSSSGFWSLKWCLVCFPTHGMGVKSNEILVGYSNKPGVTTVLACLTGRTALQIKFVMAGVLTFPFW